MGRRVRQHLHRRVQKNRKFVARTAGVAQLVEPQIVALVVAGSSPVTRPNA